MIYRTPDGNFTDNVKAYIAAWQDFAEPICTATGTQLSAFDPDIQISTERTALSLPVWFVAKINAALTTTVGGER